MGDQVIYYRRPKLTPKGEPADNAGWITWGDSKSGSKFYDYAYRGFEPLLKYGLINTNAMAEQLMEDPNAVWIPILSHPLGPAEFPVDQVITFRWYRPEKCPVPSARFPQLAGMKIREYKCPECNRAPFVDIDSVGGVRSLGNHLRISHEYDRSNLLAYGVSAGIDFNKVDVNTSVVHDYEVGEQQEVVSEFVCEICGKTAKNALGLNSHMRSHVNATPQVEVEAIG